MAMVFWDASGIIYIYFLEENKRITGQCYVLLLGSLSEKIKHKRSHLNK